MRRQSFPDAPGKGGSIVSSVYSPSAVYDPRTLNKQKRHYEIIPDASHNHISPARIGIPVCRPHQRPKDCSTKRRH
ncbi:hypothetical protein DTO207G8_9054 [Paecilomyces variotii]|nr:hypothetical protein DTO207G8_9054 [Paecilomyces variotii]KAJ9272480.1 hypothetical protein DTO212C5_1207 [Paecilomyces variotii]KAJ9400540.1 hypothetical protein DTO282F9_2425 [Paecilomyces variotii]